MLIPAVCDHIPWPVILLLSLPGRLVCHDLLRNDQAAVRYEMGPVYGAGHLVTTTFA